MATAELGSLMHEQIAPGPASREYPNRIPKTPIPRNRYEFFQQCFLDNSKKRREERRIDTLLSALDNNQALEERANLIHDPIYTGEIEPTGDGSVVIIQPGFCRGEDDYRDTIRCFKNTGYQAMVMPMTWGKNVEPSRMIAQSNMRSILKAADESGKPVIIVAHSKGVQDIEVAAGLKPKDFEQSVGVVVEAYFPNFVNWINSEVLCIPLPFSLLVTEEDLRAHASSANSLRGINKVKTVAFVNRHDRIIQGTSNAQVVIENSNSHRGALSCAENLRAILERLPKKSSRPFPAAA